MERKNLILVLVAYFTVAPIQAKLYTPVSSFQGKGTEVTHDGVILFRIYDSLGELEAEERAALITERIKKLLEDGVQKEALVVDRDGDNAVIRHRGKRLLSVTVNDAAAVGKDPLVVAHDYRDTIGKHLDDRASVKIVSLLGLVLLIIVVMSLAYFFIWLKLRPKKEG